MRYLILGFMMLSACAERKGGSGPLGSCEWQASPEQVEYDDGVIRKSDVWICTQSDGTECFYAYWVNDPSVRVTTCSEDLR